MLTFWQNSRGGRRRCVFVVVVGRVYNYYRVHNQKVAHFESTLIFPTKFPSNYLYRKLSHERARDTQKRTKNTRDNKRESQTRLVVVRKMSTTTTKTSRYENDALEVSIAKALAAILSSDSCNLEGLTIASIVDRLETSLEGHVAEDERRIKRTKKKYVRHMVQAHIDENHPHHEKAKRGEPITSATLIEEEEKREEEDEEEESDVDSETDEGGAEKYYSAKRTTRGDTKPTKKKARVGDKKGKKRKRSSTKEKEIKDPNKPKGPQGPYMCFVSHNRDKIIKEFPGIKFGEVGKKLGQRWQNLSEKGREMYNEMAEKDKERYQKEMEKYVPMSDAELNKLKQKAEKEKKEKSENSAFKKPYKCSEKLKTFLGGQETINRAQLTKEMWKYFKENNLMDPENKQFVVCDDKLFKLIGEKRFRAFGFAKYLAKDLIPM